MNTSVDIIVVGAGFAGAICARVLAENNYQVLVVDRREHIGGNAYDKYDDNGVLIHPYGPHLFHTNSERVWQWLSRFTDWRFYEHRVLAQVEGKLLPIPINRTTINQLYNYELDEAGIAEYFEKVREPRDFIQSSEDVVLNSVGSDLCDKFFRGYTKKQWGLDLSELSAGVAARIPTRTNDDDRYFSDSFQGMPKEGYTVMFKNILDHENISICLNTDYKNIETDNNILHMVYTGPVDAYFDYCYGKLPYRSLSFEHEHINDIEELQPVGTVNYPNEHAYTRITEFKHITGQKHQGTSVVREYPQADGDPYYPIPRAENEVLYKKYKKLCQAEKNVTFVGRLAQYRYYNMDQVVAASLKSANNIIHTLRDK